MYKGCKNAGQTSVHLPHLKQAVGSGILAFSSDKHNIPEVPFVLAAVSYTHLDVYKRQS